MVTDGLLPFVLYTEYFINLWAPPLLLGIHISLNCLTAHIYPCFFGINQPDAWLLLLDTRRWKSITDYIPPHLPQRCQNFIGLTWLMYILSAGVMSDIRVTTKTTTCIQLDLEPDTEVQQANLRPAPLQPFLYWQVMIIGLSEVHFLCSGSLICLSWVWSQEPSYERENLL